MITMLLGNYSIPGYGLIVTGELSLPADDLSGQGSSSLTAEKGFKPQRLKVKTNIRFDDHNQLKSLSALAKSTDATTGKRRVFNIVNDTANAMGIRQVRFTTRYTAQELDSVLAWQVSFELLEFQSTPEKIEAKTLAKPTANNKVPASDAPAVAEAAQEPETISWFEQSVLAPLDTYLSDETDNTDEIQS